MKTQLYFHKSNDQTLCFSIAEKAEDKKTLTLITPHLILPYGYVSVDLIKTLRCINIKENGTERILMRLDWGSLDITEELWPSILMLASEAYIHGSNDECNSYAREVASICS